MLNPYEQYFLRDGSGFGCPLGEMDSDGCGMGYGKYSGDGTGAHGIYGDAYSDGSGHGLYYVYLSETCYGYATEE